VAALRDYYVNKRALKFPIVVWAPSRAYDDDGNFSVPDSPNNKAFFVSGTPRFCIVDGNGRLRRVLDGYSRDIEAQLNHVVEHLIAEAGRQGVER
jgi:hypothetical protein